MGAESTMAARDRRKRKKNVVWRTFVRLFFVLLLLSMLATTVSDAVLPLIREPVFKRFCSCLQCENGVVGDAVA